MRGKSGRDELASRITHLVLDSCSLSNMPCRRSSSIMLIASSFSLGVDSEVDMGRVTPRYCGAFLKLKRWQTKTAPGGTGSPIRRCHGGGGCWGGTEGVTARTDEGKQGLQRRVAVGGTGSISGSTVGGKSKPCHRTELELATLSPATPAQPPRPKLTACMHHFPPQPHV